MGVQPTLVVLLLRSLAHAHSPTLVPPCCSRLRLQGLLLTPLLRHQKVALAWMTAREEEGAKPRGGLLADDQARMREEGLLCCPMCAWPGRGLGLGCCTLPQLRAGTCCFHPSPCCRLTLPVSRLPLCRRGWAKL